MTHGTILLTSKAEPGQILLQTPHDGQVNRALKILGAGKNGHPKLGLPEWMARQKDWRVRSAAELHVQHGFKKLRLEYFQDMEAHHATCELNLIELASWIVAIDPGVYRVIPPGFEGYLPDYDLTGHIEVEILADERSYRIKQSLDHGIKRSIRVNLIDQIHRLHLKWAIAFQKTGSF